MRHEQSLTALANDLGLITNPALRLAAGVAAETLRSRTDIRTLLSMLGKAIEQRDALLEIMVKYGYAVNKNGDEALAELAREAGE